MECSTQESSFVAAWVQEWIRNQRVGGYLVRNDDMNPITSRPPFWYFCSFAYHIDIPLVFFLFWCCFSRLFLPISVVWQMFFMVLPLHWKSFHHCVHNFIFYSHFPYYSCLFLYFDSWCSLWSWYCLGSCFTVVPTTFPSSSRLGEFCKGALSNSHCTLYITEYIYVYLLFDILHAQLCLSI